MDRPRGPDAKLSVRVPEEWIVDAATIEIQLPRNLVCAICEGGGCDSCGRSGAVPLRGRQEPPEFVEIVLPPDRSERSVDVGLLLRIPDRGGLPAAESGLPRGNLMIALRPGPEPDAFVTRVLRHPAIASFPTRMNVRRVAAYFAVAACTALAFWWWFSSR